ncbi:TPA: recombinase, partial [Streptococcus suis]|nr:recombinase [Streptococcus suis]
EDTIIQKKELAQILYDKLQDKEKWLDQLSTIQNNQELNRLTLVSLLDRIVIHENQELTLVFHDMAELEVLHQFSHRETEVD